MSKLATRQDRCRLVDPWRLPLTSKELISICAKGLVIPEKWTAREFLHQGRALINALTRISHMIRRRAEPYVATKANAIFDRQLHEVIRRARTRGFRTRKLPEPTSAAGGSGPETFEILVSEHESVWMAAIDEVMKEQGLDVALELVPPIQSVMAQGYAKTGTLLSIEADPDNNPILAQEARDIAQKITRINETTRKEFERHVQDSIRDGDTVTELANKLEEELLPMQKRRSMTIARTELNNALTRGAAQAMKECDTLAAVSVIGCQAREPGSPQFRGESTCNIENVPSAYIDELLAVGWHVNHTGTLICSSFRD